MLGTSIGGSVFEYRTLGSLGPGDQPGRIRSVPDDRVVEIRRAREEVEGPRAPQNSMDMSVIYLGDDSEVDEVEVFDAAPVPVQGPQILLTPPMRVNGGAMDLAPPVSQRGRTLDLTPPVSLHGSRLDTTIDLTNSPVVLSHGVGSTAEETSATRLSPVPSPAEVRVTCPICYDSARTLQLQGKSLVSTVCGHIFCSPCLTSSLRVRPFCPTCRKVLASRRDYHLIFLG